MQAADTTMMEFINERERRYAKIKEEKRTYQMVSSHTVC